MQKLSAGGGVEWCMSGYERKNVTHLSVFHSVLYCTRGQRLRNSVSSVAQYAFNLFLRKGISLLYYPFIF